MIWLDNSRILAVFAVVFLHVSAIPVTGSDVGSEYWWYGNIYDSMVRWCVPVLVMISGALLLDQNKKQDMSIFYRKRVSRILLPIVFWSIFYLLLRFGKSLLHGDSPSLVELAKIISSGSPSYHMWFLFMIFGLYLFTPFFNLIVAHSTDRELEMLLFYMFIVAATYSAYRSIYPASGPGLFLISFLSYMPYFFMGYKIRHTAYIPKQWVLYAICGSSFFGTAIGCYLFSIWRDLRTGFYFYNYLSLTVIPMSIGIMFILKTWRTSIFNKHITQRIASLTLGVYLVHPIVIDILDRMSFKVTAYNPALSVPMISTLVFTISLAAAWIISRCPFIRRTI